MSTETLEVKKELENDMRFYVELLQAHLEVMDLKGVKFAKKVSDNVEILNRELEPVNELMRPSEEFQEFAAKVQQEARGDSEKIAEMEKENKELVDKRHEQLTAGQEMLSQPFEIKLRHFNENELPREMTARQYMSLKPLIN